MKNSILTLVFIAGCLAAKAQTAEDSVKATVKLFFEGMKKQDTTLIKSMMTEGVIFQTISRNKEGAMVVKTENVSDFFAAVAKPSKDVLDERITFDVVRVDGALASVWTPYRFYMGEKFMHCGANSFQMVRLDGKWKIQYLIDTRRKQGCD